jgi:hypothetical protein
MGEVGWLILTQLQFFTDFKKKKNDSLKASGEQVDDRVVEVHWDIEEECWRMMRFRDDKPHGNHKDVVEKIIDSIADGVGKDVVCSSFARPVKLPDRTNFFFFFFPADLAPTTRSSSSHGLERARNAWPTCTSSTTNTRRASAAGAASTTAGRTAPRVALRSTGAVAME